MPIGFRTKRQARAPRPGGVRKTALLFLVFCLGLTVGLSAPRAQTTPTIQAPTPQPTALEVSLVQDNGTLKLSDVIPINLVPYISYYADPDGQLTPQSTLSRYIRRERAFSPFYDIFRPSAPSPMHWAIINIYNQTDLGEWTLDFGDRLTGRNSYFTGLKIVDVLTNKTILDQSITENPYGVRNERDLQLRSSISIPLRPKAVTSLAIRFTSPPHMTPHFPLTLRPGLAPTVHTPLWQSPWILGLLAGVFAGWIIFSALLSYQPSKICLGLVIALAPTHMFFPGALVHAPNLLYQYAPIFAHAIPCLCLLVGLWGLLNILKIRTATLLFLLIILGVQMGGGIAGVVLFPTNPLGAALAILVPCASLSVFMILRIMKSEPSIGLYILFGLCAFFATSLIQVATEQTLLAPTPLLLNAVLLGVYITGPLLSLAIFSLPHQFDIVEKKSPRRDRRDKDQERLEQLRIAKESFDYNNLLKVIEHERRQLAAARTRETMRGDEMRKAKEQADEANRAKGAFLAVISHEIRTPMTGIMGMVKMLVETTLTKTQHDYVRTIKESGNAMMALLNDILDFEKIESGKLQLEHLDFDLHHVITGVMALMSGHASNKGIQLNLDQEFGVPRYVIGDATRLRQVLLNLIGNGIKFTRTGSVTLKISSTASPTPDTQYMAYQIYFAIIDTGIGISAEGQKYIFNPFAQADKTITRKFGGSGLGLAISQRIIENMGSQINIKSREGDGATFFFTLTLPEGDERRIEDHAPMPAAPTPMPTATPMPPPSFSPAPETFISTNTQTDLPTAPSPAPAPYETEAGPSVTPPQSRTNPHPLRILVIEDNNVTQRVLQTMIEHQGHTTTILDMAEDALNYIQMGEKFDLILCDIQLNGMNGLDFTRKVRSMGTEFSDTVPILALSGSVEDEDIQACADAGMSGHLAKPIDPEIFDQILRDIAAMVYALPPETPATTAALNPSSLAGPAEEQAAPGPLPLTSDELEIDLLMTLRDSLGDRQLHQLLDSLYTKTEEIIAALAGQHTIDIEFTRARAHEMKGMCANFGLAKLSAQAKDIEFAAKEARIDDVATLIATLTPLYQKGRFDIENWLKH